MRRVLGTDKTDKAKERQQKGGKRGVGKQLRKTALACGESSYEKEEIR